MLDLSDRGIRVVVPDLRGHGDSTDTGATYTHDVWSDDAVASCEFSSVASETVERRSPPLFRRVESSSRHAATQNPPGRAATITRAAVRDGGRVRAAVRDPDGNTIEISGLR